MIRTLVYPFLLGAAIALAAPPASGLAASTPYPQAARLYLAAPVVAKGLVRGQSKLGKKEAASLPPLPMGQGRAFIEVELQGVLKAPTPLPARLKFLWQGPLDAKGKIPNFKKQTLLMFLSTATVNGVTGYGLTDVGSIKPWSVEEEAQLRAIASAAQDPAQRGLAIKGVRSTFVTQPETDSDPFVHILFSTQNGAPLAAILEKNRTNSTWSLRTTLTDLDQDAMPVQNQSLLWYHMACGLPAAPPQIVEQQPTPGEVALARAAWNAMLELLGPCR
jgi:hypothetical protein